MAKSIQPIVTKVNPQDRDFQFEIMRADIFASCQIITRDFMQYNYMSQENIEKFSVAMSSNRSNNLRNTVSDLKSIEKDTTLL